MPLFVIMYAVQEDDTVDVVGSHLLAEDPGDRSRREVFFGRRSDKLVAEAAGAPVLAVDDEWVSRVQGMVDWTGSAVVVTQRSRRRPLAIRDWGGAPLRLTDDWEQHTVRSARTIIDVLDTSCFLAVGPLAPLAPGWGAPAATSDQTPTLADVARGRLRPGLLCECRRSGVDPTTCAARGHTQLERELKALLAGAAAYASWPQTRTATTVRGTRKQVAAGLGVPEYELSRLSRSFRSRVDRAVEAPRLDEPELLAWLVEREIFTFDEIADLVPSVSR